MPGVYIMKKSIKANNNIIFEGFHKGLCMIVNGYIISDPFASITRKGGGRYNESYPVIDSNDTAPDAVRHYDIIRKLSNCGIFHMTSNVPNVHVRNLTFHFMTLDASGNSADTVPTGYIIPPAVSLGDSGEVHVDGCVFAGNHSYAILICGGSNHLNYSVTHCNFTCDSIACIFSTFIAFTQDLHTDDNNWYSGWNTKSTGSNTYGDNALIAHNTHTGTNGNFLLASRDNIKMIDNIVGNCELFNKIRCAYIVGNTIKTLVMNRCTNVFVANNMFNGGGVYIRKENHGIQVVGNFIVNGYDFYENGITIYDSTNEYCRIIGNVANVHGISNKGSNCVVQYNSTAS